MVMTSVTMIIFGIKPSLIPFICVVRKMFTVNPVAIQLFLASIYSCGIMKFSARIGHS